MAAQWVGVGVIEFDWHSGERLGYVEAKEGKIVPRGTFSSFFASFVVAGQVGAGRLSGVWPPECSTWNISPLFRLFQIVPRGTIWGCHCVSGDLRLYFGPEISRG